MRPGGKDAVTTPDQEYTDWNELAAFVDEYLETSQSEGR